MEEFDVAEIVTFQDRIQLPRCDWMLQFKISAMLDGFFWCPIFISDHNDVLLEPDLAKSASQSDIIIEHEEVETTVSSRGINQRPFRYVEQHSIPS